MEENYLLAYKTVLKKVHEDDKMFPFYVVGLYALLSEYKDCKDVVTDSFLETDMYFESGSIVDILKRHDLTPDDMDEIEAEEDVFDTYAVSNLGHSFAYDENNKKVTFSDAKPYIVASVDDVSIERLLNSFCHEMGHIIKGKINGFQEYIEEDNDEIEFCFRTGLSHTIYFTEDGILYEDNQYGTLDETVNTLMTTDALREVTILPLFVTDKQILDFLDKLDFDVLAKNCGYEEYVDIVRHLWKNEKFKSLALHSSIFGDEKLEESFDAIGEDSFIRLGQQLDMLFNFALDEADEDEKEATRNKCLEIIKAYNEEYKSFVKEK